jgi:hypothetical protein
VDPAHSFTAPANMPRMKLPCIGTADGPGGSHMLYGTDAGEAQ